VNVLNKQWGESCHWVVLQLFDLMGVNSISPSKTGMLQNVTQVFRLLGCCKCPNGTLGSKKRQDIFWLAEQLLAL
jgi:hypothetical protein